MAINLPPKMILKLFDQAGWAYKRIGSSIMSACPVCGGGKKKRRCLSIDAENNIFKCFSDGCAGGAKVVAKALKIDWPKFLEREGVKGLDLMQKQVETVKVAHKRLDEKEVSLFGITNKNLSSDSYFYLRKRQLDPDDPLIAQNLYELKENRENSYLSWLNSSGYKLAIPMFTPSGRCKSLKLRDITRQQSCKALNFKGHSPICFGWINYPAIQEKDWALIVEGEMDYLSALMSGHKNILAVPSSTYRPVAEELDALPSKVYLLLDNTAEGRESARKLASYIYSYNKKREIYLCCYPHDYKDANEILVRGKGNKNYMAIVIDDIMATAEGERFIPFESSKNTAENILAEIENRLLLVKEQGLDSLPVRCIKTGFSQLDKYLNEGIRPGLYGIAGRPAVGKTNFVEVLGKSILQANDDVYVLVFSLEMTKQELVAQLMSWESGISRYKIMDCNIDANGIGSIRKAFLGANIYSRYIFDDQSRTVEQMHQTALELMNELGDKKLVVFIDYLQQVQSNHKGRVDERTSAARNSYALKEMANSLDIPVIVISSTAREFYKSSAVSDKLTAFKESGNIEYSLYVGLYLDEVSEEEREDLNYKPEINDWGVPLEKLIKVLMVKNRHGSARDRNGNYHELNLSLNFRTGELKSISCY